MSKMEIIKSYLLKNKRISNVDTLRGRVGCRTNRLGAFIFKLRNKYKIETVMVRDVLGNYADCIYIYKGKTNDNS